MLWLDLAASCMTNLKVHLKMTPCPLSNLPLARLALIWSIMGGCGDGNSFRGQRGCA